MKDIDINIDKGDKIWVYSKEDDLYLAVWRSEDGWVVFPDFTAPVTVATDLSSGEDLSESRLNVENLKKAIGELDK